MEKFTYHRGEEILFSEYTDFLRRTDLGLQYPEENFAERVSRVLLNRAVSITARNEQGLLIGVCFGQTDSSYFLFLTDIGVDRRYEKSSIGREMIQKCIDLAGGGNDITAVTLSRDEAVGFYKKIEFKQSDNLLWSGCAVWTEFEV